MPPLSPFCVHLGNRLVLYCSLFYRDFSSKLLCPVASESFGMIREQSDVNYNALHRCRPRPWSRKVYWKNQAIFLVWLKDAMQEGTSKHIHQPGFFRVVSDITWKYGASVFWGKVPRWFTPEGKATRALMTELKNLLKVPMVMFMETPTWCKQPKWLPYSEDRLK